MFSISQWAERDGVIVNFEGWAQQLRPAVATEYYMRGRDQLHMSRLDRFGSPYDKWARSNKRDAREAWRFVQMIANALGENWKYKHTEEIFDEIAKLLPEFHGMSYDSIGDLGQPVAWGSASLPATRPVIQPIYREVYQSESEQVESVGSVMQ
jgi:NADH dehydrogenase/NADH:ubiquinone oxidoreductase subunit G